MSAKRQQDPLVFDKQKVRDLKKVLAKAKAEGRETFVFEERELVVRYAEYLIEYLEGRGL